MDQYKEHLDWIATQSQHMIFLTEAWSRINSGSHNIEGIRKFRKALEDNFRWLEGEMEVVPVKPLTEIDEHGSTRSVEIAEALRITKRPKAPIQILLMGHMDTVYGVDHPFQEPKFLDEKTLNGPGVADLKGGLVVMLKALEALERSPWKDQLGWQVLLNPDEEIGSVSSDPLMKEAAKGKHLGLIYEPAMGEGDLAGARKGNGNFTLVVRGRAAHSGRNPQDGRNAIALLADYTAKIFALNGKREGVTVNPAKLTGGGALNVVPDLAILGYSVRTQAVEDEAWATSEVQKIIASPPEGFKAELHGQFTRTPKPMSPQNKAVFDMVMSCASELGFKIAIKPSGGCCDGNNLWKYGLPNVDSLGVRGANIHSDKEVAYLDSLVERAQLSALLLMKLAKGDLNIESIPDRA